MRPSLAYTNTNTNTRIQQVGDFAYGVPFSAYHAAARAGPVGLTPRAATSGASRRKQTP